MLRVFGGDVIVTATVFFRGGVGGDTGESDEEVMWWGQVGQYRVETNLS